MGKGTINSHISGGQYDVTLNYDRHRITQEIARLTDQIADLAVVIAGMDPGSKKDILTLRKTSLEKRKAYLIANLSTDPSLTAWCADLTEDLTGIVGTVEVPGERGTVLIQPGYDGNAAYDAARDGQLQKLAANTPAGTFWNAAMLPGWQKWKPTYRFGTITAISGDTCDITLEVAKSSAQNLNINQAATLSGVAIEYMACNGSAFEVGDSVLIKFEGQDWASPKVVGFKESPQDCGNWVSLGIHNSDGSCSSIAVSGGNLYVGDNNGASDSVFRWDGGTIWTDTINPNGIQDVRALGDHAGSLFAGFQDRDIYRWNGSSWSFVGKPGLIPLALKSFNGSLYCGTQAHVEVWDGVDQWDKVSIGEIDGIPRALTEHDGELYAGCTNGRVYRMNGHGDWTDMGYVGFGTMIHSLCSHGGNLYVGGAGDPSEVWIMNGVDDWNDVGGPDDATYISAMISFEGSLFASGNDGNLWRMDGVDNWVDMEGPGHICTFNGLVSFNAKIHFAAILTRAVYRYDD